MKKYLLVLLLSGGSLVAVAQGGAWIQKSDIGSSVPNGPHGKDYAVGLAIGSKGYVGTGNPGNSQDFDMYDPATGKWSAKAMFGGGARTGAAGFSVGGKGYIGTGLDGTSNPWQKDFWAYDTATDTWTQVADFGGHVRDGAVGFAIGNYGYLGTGESADMDWADFWQYDPTANAWTQKATFGGHTRWNAVGFSVGGKGYIGTGNDPNNVQVPTFFSDFWEYDPAADTWTRKADFGGGVRAGAVGFSIGSYGYLGTGNAGITDGGILYEGQKDLWQYDPVADTWTRKADLPGAYRWSATGFAVGGKGYIGMGSTGICVVCGSVLYDFWQYDPATDGWTSIAGFEPNARSFANTFAIGNKGYIGLGSGNDFWQYDSAADSWTQIANFAGTPRSGAVGFAVNGLGYIATGFDTTNTYTNDLWQYDPTANGWAKKANLPGSGRSNAIAFAVGGKGYLGTGTANNAYPYPGYLKDFWEYDPTADSWTQKADFAGGTRIYAVGFGIGSDGYAGTGEDTATVNYFGDLVPAVANKKDFWQYDPTADLWTKKADFAGGDRYMATSFAAAGSGFVGTGSGDSSLYALKDFWQYLPATDSWSRIVDLPGLGRNGAAAFSLGQSGYAGSGAYSGQTFNDWWEYSPTTEVIRTALGVYQLSSACPAIAGSGFLWETDDGGALVYGIDPGGNNLGATCWGIDNLAAGSYRNTYGWFGGASKSFGAYLTRNYVLTPATEPASAVTLRFYCTTQELNDFVANFNSAYGTSYTQADIRIVRYDGMNQDLDLTNNSDNASDYTALTPTIGTYGNSGEYRYFEVTTSSLSEFAIALSSPSAPLGYSLLNFSAVYQSPATLLSWQTAQEENTSTFEIQRSVNGQDFVTIGTLAAAGNSSTLLNYHFTDGGAAQAGSSTLYYRLRETDMDGHTNYSPVAVVQIDASAAFTVYPNPMTDHVFIQISSAGAVKANLIVTDVAGRRIAVEALSLQQGNNTLYVGTSGWGPGMYYLELITDGGSWKTKLLKQ